MGTARKIQPVSFSLSDPFESQLYKHAIDNGAFSKYVKRLIQRDMERRVKVVNAKKAPIPQVTNSSMVLVDGKLVPRQ